MHMPTNTSSYLILTYLPYASSSPTKPTTFTVGPCLTTPLFPSFFLQSHPFFSDKSFLVFLIHHSTLPFPCLPFLF
ncbi:hypothetical protein VIGAN_07205800 [Vigna angularis var. angularis]|uniref:Uncharacterized protein n=1 Tax=Vigna angularis var. angularis TaxID=157739 RepID=A0A0S3SJV7_PHAAN|nr:hypothetical protein VIGAN_07205800 [Vigna angularis var. angularis]